MQTQIYDVVVIGAGVAGLRAAQLLAQAGLQVVVLEARNRLGGRIFTRHDVTDVPVELGAELIHSRLAPTWETLRAHHVPTVRLGKGINAHPHRWLHLSLRAGTFEHLPPAHRSEDALSYCHRVGLAQDQLPMELAYLNVDDEPLRRTSAAFLLHWLRRSLADGELYGEFDFRVPGGYDALPHILASNLNIKLESRVERVTWNAQTTAVQYVRDNTVQVARAKAVVITLPVGVLKHNDVQFEPALPPDKLRAIHTLGTVDVAKLVYIFDRPVLPPHTSVIHDFESAVPLWWSGTHGAEHARSGVVIGWVAGDNARELLALEPDEALCAGLARLQRVLQKPVQPVDMLLHNWSGDPFTRGTYSYVPPGAAAYIHHDLAQRTGKLFWAGEATHGRDPATVHGAYASGTRVAEEVRVFLR